MQTFWKCTDSSAISFVSVQQMPLCPLLNGLQLCTILEKNDHVFENFGEILSTFDTSLANRKQKKHHGCNFFSNFLLIFFPNLEKNSNFSRNIEFHMQFPLSFCSNQRCVCSKTGCHFARF